MVMLSEGRTDPEKPPRSPAECETRRRTTVLVDGRSWLVCPVGGPACFRVAADMDQIARDAVDFHAENHFLACGCPCCGR
ncbi:hypothetical protein [Saccharopolyspora dendranthemae]|uniref:Uncharacterized protein n=1 Tax=Saccharopolyspora dendranthemae TaxID=1181886 RepID=A0A561UA27_9PSEU|nr:hypothetical protein [Saccharopolyspora dendranthemae]TWF96208.1 hypothetical protein FHU35_121209 [Saccharopolyspora dendranthemae]